MRWVRVSLFLICDVNDIKYGEGWTGQGGFQEEEAMDWAPRWASGGPFHHSLLSSAA